MVFHKATPVANSIGISLKKVLHSMKCALVYNFSEQQRNQDLRRIYRRGVRILEFITLYQNALHLTRVHCATFYQSALRHEQHEDVYSSIEPSSFSRGCQ